MKCKIIWWRMEKSVLGFVMVIDLKRIIVKRFGNSIDEKCNEFESGNLFGYLFVMNFEKLWWNFGWWSSVWVVG